MSFIWRLSQAQPYQHVFGSPAIDRASAPSTYRPDIDGMRAIAVLAVVIFHAFPVLIPGGFIGVDIFFVISGYLISKFILENFQTGRFSLAEFYSRRVNRIFPALLLVLAASLVYGAFQLLSDEYEMLGRHIASGAAFVSNFVYLAEVDYFAAHAATKPMLHLWSLSIEEQFYLVWPPLLWFAWKRRWNVTLYIAALAAVSFLFNAWLVTSSAPSAFFQPLTRFWELLVGAALASRQLQGAVAVPGAQNRNASLQSLAGAGLLVAGFVLIGSRSLFPGWWALLPVVGAALLIAAGPSPWFNRRVLSSRPLVWVGLISYPLYLWHWPILIFAGIYASDALSTGARLAVVGASILLAWLTYRCIEVPVRSSRRRGPIALGLSASLLVVGSLAFWCMQSEGFDGFAFRQTGRNDFASYFNNNAPQHRYYARAGLAASNRDDCNFYQMGRNLVGAESIVPKPAIDPSCYQRNLAQERSVFIWGDSHAQQLGHGLRKNLPPNWQVLQVASSGCLPTALTTQSSTTDYCAQSNWFAMTQLAAIRPDVVIVAQCCYHEPKKLAVTAERLKALGIKKVLMTGPVPDWQPNLPRVIARPLWLTKPERSFVGLNKRVLEANRVLQEEFRPSDSVVLVDLIDFFCNKEGCLTRIGDDPLKGITAWDSAHLTLVASDYLARKLLVQLVTGAAPKGDPGA